MPLIRHTHISAQSAKRIRFDDTQIHMKAHIITSNQYTPKKRKFGMRVTNKENNHIFMQKQQIKGKLFR